MKPVIVLVGRQNVGKSTLFNRLTRKRDALVADLPGLTRDRLYGDGREGDRSFVLVDTGGIRDRLDGRTRKSSADAELSANVRSQIQQAISEADAIIFLTDGRDGLNVDDWMIANDLRRMGTLVWLAVNKLEGLNQDIAVADFHALGLGQPQPISAAHGEGVSTLIKNVLTELPQTQEVNEDDETPRIAVVGRPNAGKSTLVNALLGEERVIVSDAPGTTRDSIRIPMKRNNKSYVLFDTAGVRRRSRVVDRVEKYSVVKSLQAIDNANVVILVIDVVEGISEQDATLAGYVLEAGRSLVLAANKWDALDSAARMWCKKELQRVLPFISFSPPRFISALNKTGISDIFRAVDRAYASANKTMTTAKLNRVLKQALQARSAPVYRGRRIKPKYAHQGGRNPPRIIIHGNQTRSIPLDYRRYLANRFREAFKLEGTPVRLEFKEAENPFVNRNKRPPPTARTKHHHRRH